jgi:hypothetical protein
MEKILFLARERELMGDRRVREEERNTVFFWALIWRGNQYEEVLVLEETDIN